MPCNPATPPFVADTATNEEERRQALRHALANAWRDQKICRLERDESPNHHGWSARHDPDLPDDANLEMLALPRGARVAVKASKPKQLKNASGQKKKRKRKT